MKQRSVLLRPTCVYTPLPRFATRALPVGGGYSFRFFRREQVFSPSVRKEVMLMNLHDGLVAIVLALNLLLEYIAQHRKR